MKSLKKSTVLTLVLAVFAALVASGCNTMKGLGKDTERAGEKIQDKASR
jgi:predicted small secreted protein